MEGAATNKYNVRWTTHHAETWTVFSDLRTDERFVDVTLSCQEAAFRAHRIVLSACSPYLRNILENAEPGSHPIVILQDAKSEAVKYMIDFMYGGSVDIPSESLNDFIKLAECFQVKGIRETDNPEEIAKSASTTSTTHVHVGAGENKLVKSDHGLPSPPSSTHDEDTPDKADSHSPKRKCLDFRMPYEVQNDMYRKQYEAQMVHRYFRSLYYEPGSAGHGFYHGSIKRESLDRPDESSGMQEAEPHVTIEKVYLRERADADDDPSKSASTTGLHETIERLKNRMGAKNSNDDEDYDEDEDMPCDDDQPQDFSMSKPRENGQSQESESDLVIDEDEGDGGRKSTRLSNAPRNEVLKVRCEFKKGTVSIIHSMKQKTIIDRDWPIRFFVYYHSMMLGQRIRV
jgi:hypothetical protein